MEMPDHQRGFADTWRPQQDNVFCTGGKDQSGQFVNLPFVYGWLKVEENSSRLFLCGRRAILPLQENNVAGMVLCLVFYQQHLVIVNLQKIGTQPDAHFLNRCTATARRNGHRRN